jgi:hypothetical protein
LYGTPAFVYWIKNRSIQIARTAAARAMIVDTTPSIFERIHPLKPKLVRKRKKHATNVIDNVRWIIRYISGNWNGPVPGEDGGNERTRGMQKVHPRAQTINPAVAAIANPAVQSSTFRFVEPVMMTARNVNEKPAMIALMNALCLNISAIISGDRFIFMSYVKCSYSWSLFHRRRD